MRIAVINGSPKGKKSVTLQYVQALSKHMPEHAFSTHHVACEIRSLERQPEKLKAVVEDLQSCDLVLWSFPVYYTLIPGQLKRFIELVEELDLAGGFAHKPTVALSTSIRFFDHTAHEYLHELCERWDMHVFRGYSAHMEDLLTEEPRNRFLAYFASMFRLTRDRAYPRRRYTRETPVPTRNIKLAEPAALQGPPREVVLVSTVEPDDSNLAKMIRYFKGCFPFPVTHYELTEEVLRSGCLGCMHCSFDNVCAIKDKASGELREALHRADAIVYACSIRDVFLDGRFKMFMDRRFIDGHCPVLHGKTFGMILSGPLRQLANTRFLLDALADMMDQPVAGIVTDEDPPEEIMRQLRMVADAMLHLSTPAASPSFFKVGGMKLFRDFVWQNSAIFPADHRYYKKYGFYDFPQKQLGKRVQNLGMSLAFSLPPVRRVVWGKMIHYMLVPYQRAIEKM